MHDLLSQLPPPPNADTTDQLEISKYDFDTDPLRSEISEEASITIVYAAMAVESYIYDFAARVLGESYVEDNLDKLSVQSKWLVIPRLGAGHVIKKDGQVFQLLTELVKSRNEIAHHKTKNISGKSMEQLAEYVLYDEAICKRAERAIQALEIIASEAKKFDPVTAGLMLDPG
jgi:hypothetical protein